MSEVQTQNSVKAQSFGYISAALGLVAGLAWNEAIAAAMDVIFPLSKDALWVKFLYALIVTIFVVVVITVLTKIANRKS